MAAGGRVADGPGGVAPSAGWLAAGWLEPAGLRNTLKFSMRASHLPSNEVHTGGSALACPVAIAAAPPRTPRPPRPWPWLWDGARGAQPVCPRPARPPPPSSCCGEGGWYARPSTGSPPNSVGTGESSAERSSGPPPLPAVGSGRASPLVQV